LSGLETAIRNALERADHADAAVRARIYHSARAAVEKSLQKQTDADPATIALQRQRAEAVIAGVEREYAQRMPRLRSADLGTLDVAPGEVSGATPGDIAVPDAPAPRRATQEDGRLAADPDGRLVHREVERPVAGRAEAAQAPAKAARKRRRGGFLLPLLLQLTILAALIGGVLWWISANGGVEQAGRRVVESGAGLIATTGQDGSAPALRSGAGQFEGDWTPLLTPADGDRLSPGAGARIDASGEDSAGGGIVVTSSSASADGEVGLSVASDLVSAMAGREVLVAVTARAADGPTQISVRCAFSGGAECGRNRFEVDAQATDLLFNMLLPADAAAAGGTLFINADVQGQGRSIEILSVRFRPAA
jgi:hypothetical protein